MKDGGESHERTWSKKHRDAETCEQFLISYDTDFRRERAERLSLESQVELPLGYSIPNWTSQMIDEAGACFMNGLYTGCIVSLAAGVEFGLIELCPEKAGESLQELIDASSTKGYILEDEKVKFDELRNYRNDMAHSNIGNLAIGAKLQIQQVVLTKPGISEGTWSDQFEPRDQVELEIAASLAAEAKTGNLFLNVREALYDIFDRNPWKPKQPCAQS